MNTLAAAEQLYDALYTWNKVGSIAVTSVSLAFFKDLVPSVAIGTYASSTSTYTTLFNAVKTYADGYMNLAAAYTPSNGALAEQYSRSNGTPLSAHDLTWSYAAFLTAAARRAGIVPYSWGASSANTVPSSCSYSGSQGSYTSVTNTVFPPNQTPAIPCSTCSTSPPSTITTTTASSTSTSSGCTLATSVAVTFKEIVTTVYGQTIKIVGSDSTLGSWNTGSAIALSADQYTSSNNLWYGTVNFVPGEVIQYKYINVASGGAVTWEKDPNHTYTVPATCATAVTVNDNWQA